MKTLKKALKKCAYGISPEWSKRYEQSRWIKQNIYPFKRKIDNAHSLEEQVDIARNYKKLRSNQKFQEVLSLLQLLNEMKLGNLCEIGSDRGGTLLLFSLVAADDARILSIDIDYPQKRSAVYSKLAKCNQSITCLEGDSHSTETQIKTKEWLQNRELDFLFIDGDHLYEGVKADYEMYAPLVRDGGIIAFHDIVPDFFTRFGTKTPADVGEVPRYWKELRETVDDWKEFIEDPEQDGYGIGVIRVPRN